MIKDTIKKTNFQWLKIQIKIKDVCFSHWRIGGWLLFWIWNLVIENI